MQAGDSEVVLLRPSMGQAHGRQETAHRQSVPTVAQWCGSAHRLVRLMEGAAAVDGEEEEKEDEEAEEAADDEAAALEVLSAVRLVDAVCC